MTRNSCGTMTGDRGRGKVHTFGLGGIVLMLALAMAGHSVKKPGNQASN